MNRVMMLVCLASALLSSTGCRSSNPCCGNIGCRPCEMGWQRGGTDYQRFLQGPGCNCGASKSGACGNQACGHQGGGLLGGRLAGMGHSGQFVNSQPAGAGAPTGAPVAQVAYPYYTTRGPRDFLMDNPPSIGR